MLPTDVMEAKEADGAVDPVVAVAAVAGAPTRRTDRRAAAPPSVVIRGGIRMLTMMTRVDPHPSTPTHVNFQ